MKDYQTLTFRAFLEGAELDFSAIEEILRGDYAGYEEWKDLFQTQAERAQTFAETLSPLCALVFCARYAYETRGAWQAAGVDFSVWQATFTDLGVWQKACRREWGVTGLKELAWLNNHLRGKIFRLGRLQFAPESADAELVKDISEAAERGDLPRLLVGERFYYVHIPEGAPLTEEACENSFATAAKFFGGRTVFACDSWILSPKLCALLPPASNLRRFAGRFQLLSLDPDSRSAERYLFGRIAEPKEYPARTSLQKAAKEFLCRGGRIGSALGIFEYKKE